MVVSVQKRYIAFFLMIILLIHLAGCGLRAFSYEQDNDEEAEYKKVVVFKTWNPTDMGPDSPIHGIIHDFEELYPYIDIQYEYIDSRNYINQIKVELMGGEGADIYGMQTGMNYKAFRDYEEELTQYCEQAWGTDWEEHFVTKAMEQLKSEDVIYGIPLGITYAGSAWADVNMLNQYGLDVPDTYSELKIAAYILRENGQFPLALGAADEWINIDTWMSIAADVDADKLYAALNGEISFCDEEIVESFRIWQDCFRDGIFQDNAFDMTLYNDVNDMFQKNGEIPLFLNGSWALNMFTLSDAQTRAIFDAEEANHQVYAIDWNEDGEYHSITVSTDVILCLNEASEVKDEAFLFMQYLIDEGQKILVNEYMEYMPSTTDMELVIEELSENGQECLDAVLGFQNTAAGMRGISEGYQQEIITDVLERLARFEIEPYEGARLIDEVVTAYENG